MWVRFLKSKPVAQCCYLSDHIWSIQSDAKSSIQLGFSYGCEL